MTKTLFLLRHAKTEPDNPAGDEARELTIEGIQQTRQVGQELQARGVQHVLSSSAVRTRQTLEGLELGDVHAEFMDALYVGDVEDYLQRIQEIPDEVDVLLVIGHSPTIPQLGARLAWPSQPGAADQLRCSYPTSTLTEFRVDGSWQQLGEQASVELVDVNRPSGRI